MMDMEGGLLVLDYACRSCFYFSAFYNMYSRTMEQIYPREETAYNRAPICVRTLQMRWERTIIIRRHQSDQKSGTIDRSMRAKNSNVLDHPAAVTFTVSTLSLASRVFTVSQLSRAYISMYISRMSGATDKYQRYSTENSILFTQNSRTVNCIRDTANHFGTGTTFQRN
jgi:hypothetical protein